MKKLDCPFCSKTSFSPSAEYFRKCPHCDVFLHEKYIREKRTEPRSKKEIPFLILYNRKNIRAQTQDISSQGLGVIIFDRTSLVSGDTVNLKIGKSYVMLEVVWIKTKERSALSLAGLKLRDGIISY